MYLGETSLSALWHWLHGYHSALCEHKIDRDDVVSDLLSIDFHNWVANRLHFYESTSGWKNMILAREPSESAALSKFFELLDEYDRRVAPRT